jgi:hypothetical protein
MSFFDQRGVIDNQCNTFAFEQRKIKLRPFSSRYDLSGKKQSREEYKGKRILA